MPTGGQSLAAGILQAGQSIGAGIQRKGENDFARQEQENRGLTLKDLIALGQQGQEFSGNMLGGEAGPLPADTSTQYPPPQDIPDDLAARAGKYGLLDFYLNLRKSSEPDFKIAEGSIIRFPSNGGTPGIVGTLPTKQKQQNSKQEAFKEMYQYFISSGISPDKAFEKAMIVSEAGKRALEGDKTAGKIEVTKQKGLVDEKIARMNNSSREFIAQLKADASRDVAGIRADATKSGKATPFKYTIRAYPGKIGGALVADDYTGNPDDPNSMMRVMDKIDVRISAINAMANTSSEKRGFKWGELGTWLNAFKDSDAQETWAAFIAQDFAAQAEPGYEKTGDEFSVGELPGDLELMGEEYVNILTLKRHIEKKYGFSPALEAPGQGGADGGGQDGGGGSGEIEQMKAELKKYAETQGGDPANVDDLDEQSIRQAYQMLLDQEAQ